MLNTNKKTGWGKEVEYEVVRPNGAGLQMTVLWCVHYEFFNANIIWYLKRWAKIQTNHHLSNKILLLLLKYFDMQLNGHFLYSGQLCSGSLHTKTDVEKNSPACCDYMEGLWIACWRTAVGTLCLEHACGADYITWFEVSQIGRWDRLHTTVQHRTLSHWI